ncbi:MAG: hypothetical protein ACRD0B_07390, partial [Acidimicrobiales bacterium]
GGLAGLLLSAPLWWPGIQLLQLAHRTTETAFSSLPATSMSLLVAAGFYGLPIGSSPFFLKGWNYYESVAYIGVVVLVLCAVGVARQWRRPSVLALVALAVVGLLITYQSRSFHPVQSALDDVAPQVEWVRFRSVLGLPFGLLGGIGLEMVGAWRKRGAFFAFCAGTLALGAVAGVLAAERAPGVAATAVRARSLIWPFALVGTCVACALLWLWLLSSHRRGGVAGERHRRRRWRRPLLRAALGASLWAASASFLLFAGVGINSYASSPFETTAAIRQLRHLTGGSLVALDGGNTASVQKFVPVGFYPEVNLGYGVAELAGHDPVIPREYFRRFGASPGGSGYLQPDISTLAMARRYGARFILVAAHLPAVAGAPLVAEVAGERLYEVPDSSRFSLSGSSSGSGSGSGTASAVPMAGDLEVRQPAPSEYDVTVFVRGHGARLRARVTAVPGWHATVDGRPAHLSPTRSGAPGYSLLLPPGRHHVRLWYLPDRLGTGLVAAAAGTLGLALWAGIGWGLRRGRGRG